MAPVSNTPQSASPPWADEACDAAFRQYNAGLAEQAQDICRRLLEVVPDHAPSLYLLALIAINHDAPGPAFDYADRAAARMPHSYFCHLLRGQALVRLKRFAEALPSLRRALQLCPEAADALAELAAALSALEGPDAGIPLYRGCLERKPDHLHALIGLGAALHAGGRPSEALDFYSRALLLAPGNLVLKNKAALACGESGNPGRADALFREILAADPDNPQARFNLSQSRFAGKRYGESLAELDHLIGRHPSFAEAVAQKGTVLFHLGRTGDALRWYRERGRLCRTSPVCHSILAFARHYDPELAPAAVFDEHRLWNRLHAPPCPPRPPIRRSGRVRIGYVSGDFRIHPVGWFFLPVLAAHDRRSFDIYCYSAANRSDRLTKEISRQSVWREAWRLTDDALARQVREDGIDVLVDLSGHTGSNRLLAFARRPAPVQVTWLGYPGTTGLDAMDYRISDPWADPPGLTERYHSEQLHRLPGGFLCYGPDPESPAPAPPAGPVTFGCFNAMAKLNDRCWELWARILNAVPGSRLYLKNSSLASDDPREPLRSRFAAAGGDPSRLLLDGYAASHAGHLAAYNLVDVALDSFPYNGTTTTYDALWMGVPVVGLAGGSHVSRVGVSILTRAGHPEWLASTPEEYVDIAVRLADRSRHAHRERLLPAGMLDGASFTRTLEAAYLNMLNTAEQG